MQREPRMNTPHRRESFPKRLFVIAVLCIARAFAVMPLQAAPGPGNHLNIPGFEKYAFKSFVNPSNQLQNLYIYVCKPAGWKASDSRSAMVFIHGGGYQCGDPSEVTEYCQHFARRGMVAFAVEYRIGSRDATAAEIKNWNFWKPRSDCIEAIRWIRSRTDSFGIAPNRIVMGGWSAGVDASLAATFGAKHVPSEFSCGDPSVSSVPDAIFLQNGALIECLDWFKPGDYAPPVLVLKGDRDHVTPAPRVITRQFFNTVFAAQPQKEMRVYRSDFTTDGSTNYEAGHVCFLSVVKRYCQPMTIDLDEWLVSLGFLPNREAPLLVESNGVCEINAVDFSDRVPRILQNAATTLVWQISCVKDASQGYLMDCVPPSAKTLAAADVTNAPRLDYRIKFSTPGKYYVFAKIRSSWEASHKGVRGHPEGPFFFRSKQLRLGVSDRPGDRMLADKLTTTPDGIASWQRTGSADPIVVVSPGIVTLSAYGASAGIRLEQIMLTTNEDFKPPTIPVPPEAGRTTFICSPPEEENPEQWKLSLGGEKNPVLVPHRGYKIILEGDPATWAYLEALPSPYSRKTAGMLKMAWREDGLYGCFQIPTVSITRANTPLADDAVELWFDMDLARDDIMSGNACQIVLAPDPATINGPCLVHVPQGKANPGAIQTMYKKSGDGVELTFFIPAGEFKQPGLTIGTKLGFQYAITQNGKVVEQFFCDKDEDEHYATPSSWGVIQLGK